MQLQAASPFFPAPTWHRPQVSAPVPSGEPSETVELSSPETPTAAGLAPTGRKSAVAAAGPLLGLLARAAGGNCPYLQGPARVGSFEFARTVATHLDNPHQVVQELHRRHGDSLQVRLPGQAPMLFDSRPDVMHQALAGTRGKKGEGVWEKSPRLAHGFSYLFGEQNVFSGTGAEWRRSREILEPVMRGSAIHTEEVLDHVCDVFDRHLEGVPEGVLDLRDLTQRAAMDSAFQVLFGAHLSRPELDETLAAFGTVRRFLAAETLNPTPLSLGKLGAPGLDQAQRCLAARADTMIADRRASGEQRQDALGALLAADPPLTEERLQHEVLTLMLAGHETTASFLSWSLLELAHHPEEQKQVQESLDALDGQRPDLKQYQQQTAEVKLVMMESMRLHSPAYVMARVAEEDTWLADTFVPQGTTLVMSPLESHQNRQAWGEDADQFRPRRFRGSASKMFGFGGGTRLCLGQNLARLESTVFLTRFLQRFELEPVSGLVASSDVSHHPTEALVRVRLRS